MQLLTFNEETIVENPFLPSLSSFGHVGHLSGTFRGVNRQSRDVWSPYGVGTIIFNYVEDLRGEKCGENFDLHSMAVCQERPIFSIVRGSLSFHLPTPPLWKIFILLFGENFIFGPGKISPFFLIAYFSSGKSAIRTDSLISLFSSKDRYSQVLLLGYYLFSMPPQYDKFSLLSLVKISYLVRAVFSHPLIEIPTLRVRNLYIFTFLTISSF